MEKEVSNSSLLGLIILGLCGLGVIGGIIYYIVTTFFIQEGGLKLTLPQIFFFLVAVCGIAEYFFIKSNNDKLNIWDNSGYEYEDNLVALADVDYYESSFQIRTPKKVSYLKALRCKLGDISEKKTLKFGNDTVVDIEGVVNSIGEYYLIGDKYLKKGFILLSCPLLRGKRCLCFSRKIKFSLSGKC